VNALLLQATVVIVTKDRRDEVLRAVRSAVAQEPPLEVLVIDDGSSDGTIGAIEEEFPNLPNLRVHRFDDSAEVTVRRNFGAELASTPFLVVMDDDAEFSSPNVVAQTLADFEHERIGAVAIPYTDVPVDERVLQQAPEPSGVWVTNLFRATAFAMRRDLYVRLGGFRTLLVHQAEEPDLCIRLLNAGFVLRLGRSDPILHHASPRRNLDRIRFYGCRNDVVFAWHYAPPPYLAARMLKITLHQLWLGLRARRPLLSVRALLADYSLSERRNRRPVSRDLYRLYWSLEGHPERLEEVEPRLPVAEDAERDALAAVVQ
jgi:glycosyltransferase involved in cell wall biosynthesis